MAKRKRPAQPAPASRTPRGAAVWIGALAVATVLAYSNSLTAAFVNDDRDTFLTDASLGKFRDLSKTLLGVQGGPSGGRPLTSLSFHLNALVAGRNPAAYRVVNIAIHLLAGVVLFLLVRRLRRRPDDREPDLGGASFPAFAVAVLWLVHPLQTESVTYISQRAESLMGLFFLLTVYGAVRAFQEAEPERWYRIAAIACLASVLAKEVGAVAPLVVLAYDRARVSASLKEALRKHRRLYLAFGVSWLVFGALQFAAPRGTSVGFSDAVMTPVAYLARQVVALPIYLKLAFWPSPLIFDYGFPPPAPPAWEVAAGALFLAGLLAASLWATAHRRLAGFAGVSFFLILAPTSTVIPILTEVIAEHRMYLPLACVLGLAVAAVTTVTRPAALRSVIPPVAARAVAGVLLVGGAAALIVLTRQRNVVYGSELSLWRDTCAKVAGNPRAESNLGMALTGAGDTGAAIERFRTAVALQPGFFEANANLGLALERLGKLDEAQGYLASAAALKPANPTVQTQLVRVLTQLGRLDEAVAAGKAYVAAAPDSPQANALYASLLARKGRTAEAQEFRMRALALAPRR